MRQDNRILAFWGLLFALSLVLFLIFLANLATIPPVEPTPIPTPPGRPPPQQSFEPATANVLGLIASMLTAAISAAGFATTTILALRRERRDSQRHALELERLQREVDLKALEVEKLRQEIGRNDDRPPV